MRDWVFDFWIPTLVLGVIVGVLVLAGLGLTMQHQGYNRWVDKLEAQNGALICEDKNSQIVRFER